MDTIHGSTAFGIAGSWLAEYTLTSLGAGLVLFDASGSIVQWDAPAADLLGVTEEALAGRALHDHELSICRSDLTPISLAGDPVRHVLETGDPVRGLDVNVPRAGARRASLTLNLLPVFGADRETRAVLASIVETSVAAAERQSDTSSSSAGLAAFHGALTANFLVDRAGGVADWNARALMLTNRSHVDMIGGEFADVCDIDVDWVWDQAAKNGGGVEGTTWVMLPGGDQLPVYARFSIIESVDGAPVVMAQLLNPAEFGGSAVATERTGGERLVFEHANLPLLTITDLGMIVDANVHASELFGRSRIDLAGQPLLENLVGLSEDRLRQCTATAQISRQPVSVGDYDVRVGTDAVARVTALVSSMEADSPSRVLLLQLVEARPADEAPDHDEDTLGSDVPPRPSETPDANELFEEFARTGRRRVRNEIVEQHMGLAIHIAKRFSMGDRRDADIEQVAMLALVKAVDRFDPTKGVPFAAFAGCTIDGEVKRHFRDATWPLKVPRGAKELHLSVRRGSDELSARLGRSPSVSEVADHLALSEDDVITGLSAGAARRVESIDPTPGCDSSVSVARQRAMSTRDCRFVDVENESVVEQLLASLPEREREIVRLRFYEELSQVEIAEIVGLSQMHVSRLLKRAFETLRQAYGDEVGDAA